MPPMRMDEAERMGSLGHLSTFGHLPTLRVGAPFVCLYRPIYPRAPSVPYVQETESRPN